MNIDMRECKSKTIWLINPYGPIEGENWREYSFNQFGKFLASVGFKVVWWTSSFSHHFKKQRSHDWLDIDVTDGFLIRIVPTTSYKKNFGFGRLRKDFVFSIKVLKRARKEQKPDLIIANDNPLTMGKPSFKYASLTNTPIIYDQMDIWPEFFVKSLKKPFRWLANLFLTPVYIRRKKIYSKLDGAIALGENYLEFMFEIAPSLKNKPNALVYNGIDVGLFRKKLNGKISVQLPIKGEGDIWIIFAGTLGPSYDIQTILETSKMVSNKIKFIFAGSGPLCDEVVKESQKNDSIIYIGKLLPKDLIPVYGMCDIGLCAYSAKSNVDMCDKYYDYTSAGLAIINSLNGEVGKLVSEFELGVNYIAGDSTSLNKAISEVVEYNNLKKFRNNSYNIAMKFDMNESNRELLGVINKVLEKTQKS